MVEIIRITPDFAVAPQIRADDIAQIRAEGFTTLVNNRPEWEDDVPLSDREAAAETRRHRLAYAYVPAAKDALFDDALLDAFEAALKAADGPVLAYCLSGTRSAILWAMVTARTRPVDLVLHALSRAGIDIAFLRDELEEQAERRGIIAPAGATTQPPSARSDAPRPGLCDNTGRS